MILRAYRNQHSETKRPISSTTSRHQQRCQHGTVQAKNLGGRGVERHLHNDIINYAKKADQSLLVSILRVFRMCVDPYRNFNPTFRLVKKHAKRIRNRKKLDERIRKRNPPAPSIKTDPFSSSTHGLPSTTSVPAVRTKVASIPKPYRFYFNAHQIHMTAITAITIAPEAMNTASDCQKVKFPP